MNPPRAQSFTRNTRTDTCVHRPARARARARRRPCSASSSCVPSQHAGAAVDAARQERETEIRAGRREASPGRTDGRTGERGVESEGTAASRQRPRVSTEGCVFNSRSASLFLFLRFPASLFLHLPSPLLFSVTRGLAGRQADVSRGCRESGRHRAEGR